MPEETPAELRDQLDSVTKDLKKAQSDMEKLTKENRSLKASSAFSEAGLKPELAKLYVAANPDVTEFTADAAKEFAASAGIPIEESKPATGDEGTQQDNPDAGLAQMSRAGSGAGEGGQPSPSAKLLERDEFLRLQVENPAEAQKALAEGRVKLRGDNPLAATASAATRGVNPFDRRVTSDE